MEHIGPHGSLRHTQHLCDFRVGVALRIEEDYCHPLPFRKAVESLPEPFAEQGLVGGAIRQHTTGFVPLVEHLALAHPAPAAGIESRVQDDPHQPRAERPGGIVPIDRAPCGQHPILDSVVGIIVIPEDGASDAPGRQGVRFDQQAECVAVTTGSSNSEIAVCLVWITQDTLRLLRRRSSFRSVAPVIWARRLTRAVIYR